MLFSLCIRGILSVWPGAESSKAVLGDVLENAPISSDAYSIALGTLKGLAGGKLEASVIAPWACMFVFIACLLLAAWILFVTLYMPILINRVLNTSGNFIAASSLTKLAGLGAAMRVAGVVDAPGGGGVKAASSGSGSFSNGGGGSTGDSSSGRARNSVGGASNVPFSHSAPSGGGGGESAAFAAFLDEGRS
jgi:hypothetical protein